ncbi:MAG: hypothetical protein Q8K86_09075 [Candidatus Nanopelagicaceae bacterium]|nr:hypothetical protein [Candidatus Nanopelagicaceae bacterium]
MEWIDVTKKAVKRLVSLKLPKEYADRLKVECKQIDIQGANEYWIDAVNENKKFPDNKNGLLLPFLLELIDVDPIKTGLSHKWERHPDVPDVDIDWAPDAREKIKNYVSNKYGADHVCSVGLWQSYNPKLAIQDAARALGKNLSAAIHVTKGLPDTFDDMTKDAALEEAGAPDASSELRTFHDYYGTEEGKMVVDTAYRMIGLLKAQGKHAAGMIISDVNLFDFIPMSKLGGVWTSQWTEGYSPQLSKFGFVKWDVLGLKTLFYIWKAMELAKQGGKDLGLPVCRVCSGVGNNDGNVPEGYGDKCLECSGSGVCWEEVDYNQPDVLELANELKTEAVFQFETDLAKSILSKGGVKSLNDLLIYTSLGRPGPLPLIDEYIKRRDGKSGDWRKQEKEEVAVLFESTFGIVVFQEQLQRYWVEICGFTIPEAEAARKAVSKKWGEKLEKIMKRAEDGAAKRIGREEAVKWNEKIKTFGRYAFNMSHAQSYTIISFMCLYMKKKFPSEFWAAVLTLCHKDKMPKYVGISRSEGIKFSGLHCDRLAKDFGVKDDVVLPGLLGIKGLGDKKIQKILSNVGRSYKSVDEFIEINGDDKIIMERLIKLGAFDHINPHRRALWGWYRYRRGEKDYLVELRNALIPPEELERKKADYIERWKAEHLGKEVPRKVIGWQPKIDMAFEQIEKMTRPWDLEETLKHEMQLFGFHFTSSLLNCFRTKGYDIEGAKEDGIVECVVQECSEQKTQKGMQFLRLSVADRKDTAKVTVWDMSQILDRKDVAVGSGVRMEVIWDEKYRSFSLRRHTKIVPLTRKGKLSHVPAK